MGYGLRYEYGIFKQTIQNGCQPEQPDNWLRRADPWEVVRPHETVEIKLNCSFELHAGSLHALRGQPSSLIGIPYDRPIVGYGGKTINTLRLWAAAAPDYFDFQKFSTGDFVAALAESLAAESITRVLYPDDSTSMGQALRSYRSTSSSRHRSRIWFDVSGAATTTGACSQKKSRCSSMTRIPRSLFPS